VVGLVLFFLSSFFVVGRVLLWLYSEAESRDVVSGFWRILMMPG
jgi:hypothetical protein